MNLPKAKRIQLAKLLKLVQEIQTEEGVVLFVEGDVTVGTEIFVSDGDGNMVPAPDGVYTSEGKVISVQAGKIAEIKEVEATPVDEAPAEEMEEEAAEETAEETDPTDTDNVEDLKARIAELESQVAEKDATIEELKAKLAEYEENEKTPAAEPIEEEEKKEKFSEQESLTSRILKSIM